MKTVRLAGVISTHLKETDCPLTTRQILDHVNTRMRHGSTMHQLSNVLSKRPEFIQFGHTQVSGMLSRAGYEMMTWVHADRECDFDEGGVLIADTR